MNSKYFLFFLFILTAEITPGQVSTDKNFEKFSIQQVRLFTGAYEKRDTVTYNKLLTEYLSNYNKLSEKDKKTFSGYLINVYYNLSCTYALLDNKAKALNYLKRSIEAGYIDCSNLQKDPDLDKIRNEKEFKALVEPLRGIGDFLYILKKGSKYNSGDKRDFPKFVYQSANEPSLVRLKNTYNLDSIAGTGNEISRMLNLLHWIHNFIPHDGMHGTPKEMNAENMISVCVKEKRGLNCRGLAITLNECYLSMGFKSRYVTCLPKDSLGIDKDCHVINTVFSNSLGKWIWLDPTNDAYIMNEKGELLSIEEVRERLIENRPLILNPDANWNRKESTVKEHYLYNYMAKNLYILECPLVSEYDSETFRKGKVIRNIRLQPIDYIKQNTDNKPNDRMVISTTNNSEKFWERQ